MKRYWDASALIDALHDSRIEQKALEPGQWTRPHALAETFATLTGGRLGFRYLPDDAAAGSMTGSMRAPRRKRESRNC